ncbi:MAG TPA: hypothetical protein VL979_00285 [Solirubrobacteraceae bacterium]|nr:hypothetical protein [Solirubrobacteraceae bacterium]
MRKALAGLAWLVLAMLAIAGVATAAPIVTMKAEPVPIPGFPHTGDLLGAGAAAQTEITIEGDEYFGSPPPVIGVNAYFPKGVKLHPEGFPTCPEATLEAQGPIGCPQGSQAGPIGKVLGFVTIGGERVEETSQLFSFYKAGGGVLFFVDGHTPVSLEILSPARLVDLAGSDGHGPEVIATVPLVASLPGAPFASARSIDVEVGSGRRAHGKAIYYGRLPSTCPRGGWPVHGEVIFAEGGEATKPEIVDSTTKVPCPNELRSGESRTGRR